MEAAGSAPIHVIGARVLLVRVALA